MSHLLYWPTITYFYPVGNTSAVCLTENLPPERKADILLLACGDPRHILYTIYADETNPLARQRPLDITCCDVDIAILARNALLFTLLADEGALDKLDDLWNLFYHMFVDQTSLSVLFEQCRKLIPLAESPETWRAGPYGYFLTTCDAATLAGLRRMWTAYVDTATFSPQQANQFERSFIRGMEEMSQRRKSGTTAARSAGPFASYADQAVARQFSSYWSSGITGENAEDRGQMRLQVNPTFVFSLNGDEFSVHYATDPLCGFHLAEAFTSGRFLRLYEGVPQHEFARVAKDQFSRWCTSVGRRLKDTNPSSPTFVVRMFAGDALRLCQALKYRETTGSPATPYTAAAWRLSTVTLDARCYGPDAAPLSFDVIDTSNISDHVGLVNLLVVAAPLLRQAPSATLYTEALLKKGDNSSQADPEHICGDLATMALLLGVVPSTYVSRFTTPYHERLAWKTVGPSGPRVRRGPDDVAVPAERLSFPPEHLAEFLFRVYLQMFSDEDAESRLEQLPFFSLERLVRTTRRARVVLHYTRRSFALLAQLVKTRVRTDWGCAMALLEKKVMADTRLSVGQEAYQELCCHLHLLGVYTAEWMSAPALQRLQLEYGGPSDPAGMFRDWTPSCVPQVVTLALVVPRDAVSRLEYDFDQIGTPMMQCEVREGPRVNDFGATSATCGSLRVSGAGEHRTGVVVEGDADAAASGMQPPWRTEAPLIVTFAVPSVSVMDFARNPEATVALVLRATPNVAARLTDRLGPELTVFRTALRDAAGVFVLTRAPVVETSADVGVVGHWREEGREFQEGVGDGADVHVQMNDAFSAVRSLTIRVDVTDPDARVVLANKQTVPTVNSRSGSARSADVYVRIGKYTFSLRFPLPVDVEGAKLRVARKSSYVEVVAPLAPFDDQAERDISSRFAPLCLDPDDDGTPTLGSIHRLNLDRCPTLELAKGQSESGWFDSHLRLMFSEEEQARELDPRDFPKMDEGALDLGPDAFLRVKRTLRALLRSAAEATRDGKAPEKAFVLCDASRKGAPYLYVVVARACLDVGSHTVVADAFVALGTPAARAALETTERGASASKGKRVHKPDDGAIQRLATDADETAAWFLLLPRLTERCRTWPHKPSCAHRTAAWEERPVGEGPEAPGRRGALCMCGQGVGTEVLPEGFARVAPYLTRAALSPLISVPYLEGVVDVPVRGAFMDMEMRSPWEDDARLLGTRTREWGVASDVVGPARGDRCRACGKEGSRACSGCKRVRYCSRACQRADWKDHKKHCR